MAGGPRCASSGGLGYAQCSRFTAVYCSQICRRADWSRRRRATCKRPSTAAPAPAVAGGAARSAPSSAAAGPPRGGRGSFASGGAGGAGGAGSGGGHGSGPDFGAPAAAVAATPSSYSGTPGDPAAYDLRLTGERSIESAQRIVDCLRERGVCIVKAGADASFQKALQHEAARLWADGAFGEAKKGQPVVPGSEQIRYNLRDDKVLWLTSDWTQQNEAKCKALKVLDSQLTDFGLGLNKLLEDQLGLTLQRRSCGMCACYDGNSVPGARYDFHVDNPYQTSMEVPDDKRRLSVVYYINAPDWDVQQDGGALQLCLAGPRRAPRTAAEALRAERLTVAPTCDTLVVFFSHTMYHAVLPVLSGKRRFALSTWFQCP